MEAAASRVALVALKVVAAHLIRSVALTLTIISASTQVRGFLAVAPVTANLVSIVALDNVFRLDPRAAPGATRPRFAVEHAAYRLGHHAALTMLIIAHRTEARVVPTAAFVVMPLG